MEEISQQKISEIITLNRHAGDTFTIKMKDSPSVFLGIPLPAGDDPEKFILNLLNPSPGRSGRLYEGKIEDIQFLEKV